MPMFEITAVIYQPARNHGCKFCDVIDVDENALREPGIASFYEQVQTCVQGHVPSGGRAELLMICAMEDVPELDLKAGEIFYLAASH